VALKASAAQENNMGVFDNLWCFKHAPKKLEDLVLTIDNRAFFEDIRRKGECPNLMLAGSPGLGKTTISKIIVNDILDCQYLYINASEESGVDVVRSKIMSFAQTRSIDGKIKVVILDEIDGASNSVATGRTSAQQALRNVMEEFAGTTRFILTCNYPYKVIPAIHSRCQSVDMTPPYEECLVHCINILKKEKVKVNAENKKKIVELIKSIYPDIRKIINTLQKNTINNELIIRQFDSNLEFASAVFEKLTTKKDVMGIRAYVIQNEITFGNDYRQLLHDLHEVVYQSSLALDKKSNILICLGNALLYHEQVADKEINFFTCLLEITKML